MSGFRNIINLPQDDQTSLSERCFTDVFRRLLVFHAIFTSYTADPVVFVYVYLSILMVKIHCIVSIPKYAYHTTSACVRGQYEYSLNFLSLASVKVS